MNARKDTCPQFTSVFSAPTKLLKIHYYMHGNVTVDDHLGEDETISITVPLIGGYEADIKCCGVKFDPAATDDNHAWSEAVVFDPQGAEVYHTDPEDTFEGLWFLDDVRGLDHIIDMRRFRKEPLVDADKAGYEGNIVLPRSVADSLATFVLSHTYPGPKTPKHLPLSVVFEDKVYIRVLMVSRMGKATYRLCLHDLTTGKTVASIERDELFGTWELFDDGNIYTVNIAIDDE